MRWSPPLLLLLACGSPVPEACEAMCAAAAPLQADCLDEDGLGWEASTWGSQAAFVDGCEAWAWQMMRLERDGRRRGTVEGTGHTVQACTDRGRDFTDADASCDTYEAVDWERIPGTR